MTRAPLAYARLLRLSNAPTTVADVWMGYAVATGRLEPTAPLVLVTLASLCLYHGGMALNDAVDAEQDAVDNRGRPIAAGLISPRVAWRAARGLLLLGLAFGIAADLLMDSYFATLVAMLLIATIGAYNSPLKRTLAGPPLMGACRALNGLLGMSVAPAMAASAALRILPGVFLYVDGLTLFARDESRHGRRWQLAAGLAVALLGLGWLAASPSFLSGPEPLATPRSWALFWGVSTLIAVRGMAAGLLQPTPKNIGRGVGLAIQGLIVIDATLATLYAGPPAGLAVFALLPVTMLLSRSIPQT